VEIILDSLDKLTIDTPEQIAIEFPLAGIGSRFLAIAFDMLLQFIGYVVLALIAALPVIPRKKASYRDTGLHFPVPFVMMTSRGGAVW
jgi:uncharacterized RDD family membrane protein YckC